MLKILEELKAREPIFHHPDKFGTSEEAILNQVCDDFWEVGASGSVYTIKDVVSVLRERYTDPNYKDVWEARDFELRQISNNSYLLTYILTQDNTRLSRRSTIWKNIDGLWKIFYHQGTIIGE